MKKDFKILPTPARIAWGLALITSTISVIYTGIILLTYG